MKPIIILFALTLFCTEVTAQGPVSDFRSLIESSNVNKKSEYIHFEKTDNGVDKTVKKLRNYRLDSNKFIWTDGNYKAIDSLDIIDYRRDIVLIVLMYSDVAPSLPFTQIVTKKSKIEIHPLEEAKLVEKDMMPSYGFHVGHPVVLDAVRKWDVEELRDIVSRIGLKDGTYLPNLWDVVVRIVVEDRRKIETSVVNLGHLSHMGVRIFEDGVSGEVIRDIHEIPSNITN